MWKTHHANDMYFGAEERSEQSIIRYSDNDVKQFMEEAAASWLLCELSEGMDWPSAVTLITTKGIKEHINWSAVASAINQELGLIRRSSRRVLLSERAMDDDYIIHEDWLDHHYSARLPFWKRYY